MAAAAAAEEYAPLLTAGPPTCVERGREMERWEKGEKRARGLHKGTSRRLQENSAKQPEQSLSRRGEENPGGGGNGRGLGLDTRSRHAGRERERERMAAVFRGVHARNPSFFCLFHPPLLFCFLLPFHLVAVITFVRSCPCSFTLICGRLDVPQAENGWHVVSWCMCGFSIGLHL